MATGFERPKFDFKPISNTLQATTPIKKNFLQDNISTGGGIAGSLGGAALGTAILPGIGTIIGGILGGALGSAGGQVAENAIVGEKDLSKDVGSEALMGGVFGTPILRSGKAIIGGGKALLSGAGKTAANTAVKEALGTKILGTAVKGGIESKLAKSGTTALGEAWGIRPGVKLSGKLVTPQSAKNLQTFAIDKIGVGKLDNATNVFEKTVNYLDNIGSGIDNTVKNIPVDKINVKSLSKDLTSKLNGMIGVNVKSNPIASDIISKIGSAKTPNELWQLRKEIDQNLISWGRNPAGLVPGTEQVARTARTEISKALGMASPELKSLNSQYSKALNVIDLSAAATKTPKGFKIPGFQQTVGGGTAQSIKAGAGSVLNQTGSLIGGVTSKIPQGLGGATLRQVGGRAYINSQQPPSLDEALMQQSDQTQPPTSLFQQQISGASDMQGMEQPQSQNPYPREALLYDIQRDPSNSAKYFDYYNNIQALYPEQSAQKYSSVISGNLSDFQSSLNELSNLSTAITSGQGSTDPIMGRLRSLNPYDTEQQTLQAMIDKTRQIVGKALEGGVLRKEDEEKYKKILPTTSDTKEVALNKIAMITNQLSQKMGNYGALVGAGGGNSLEDAIMQSQSQTSYNNLGGY